jgi:hypothetical protein
MIPGKHPVTKPTTAFAPVLPSVFKRPNGADFIPIYKRVKAYNRSLSEEQLAPLSEPFTAPGRTLRRTGGWALLITGSLPAVVLLGAAAADVVFSVLNVSEAEEDHVAQSLVRVLDTSASIFGWAVLAVILVVVAGVVVDIVALRKWAVTLQAAWERHEGRIVHTKDVPKKRRQKVEDLCIRLQLSIKHLDAMSMAHCTLVHDAKQALNRYIDLPLTSQEARRVALSDVQDDLVQQVREAFLAAEAGESVALQEAEAAVSAMEGQADEIKREKTGRKIVELAKAVAGGSVA